MTALIRSTWQINTRPLDDLAEFAGDFTRLATEIGESVFQDLEEDLLDELRFYPAPPANSTYIRTYRLRDGWNVHLAHEGNGFAVILTNDVSYAKYVVGSLAKAKAAAARFQAAIHKDRWPLATETASFWYEAFLEVYQERFAAELAKFGTITASRRTFTR